MRAYVLQNDRSGPHFGAFTYMYIAKDLRTRTEQHAVANLWVTVAVFLTCAAQRD